jgi:hypothetical protein
MTLLTTDEALTEVDRLEAAGIAVLGAEGFTVHASGEREPRMDLILDLSSIANDVSQCAEEARAFLQEHRGSQVTWDLSPDMK